MKHIKSERLKKYERELEDLEQWLKLELVPKKDIPKHKEEIRAVKEKLKEEMERLRFLKESGEVEEYITPKRNPSKGSYADMPTIPDMEVGETSAGVSETSFEESTTSSSETTLSGVQEEKEEETLVDDEEEESFFSDRHRWRGEGIIDPEANDW